MSCWRRQRANPAHQRIPVDLRHANIADEDIRAALTEMAACVSLLGGEGAGLAMVEAYALADTLRNCGGDHIEAFAGISNA